MPSPYGMHERGPATEQVSESLGAKKRLVDSLSDGRASALSRTPSVEPGSSSREELAELGTALRRAGFTLEGLLSTLRVGQGASERPPGYEE